MGLCAEGDLVGAEQKGSPLSHLARGERRRKCKGARQVLLVTCLGTNEGSPEGGALGRGSQNLTDWCETSIPTQNKRRGHGVDSCVVVIPEACHQEPER